MGLLCHLALSLPNNASIHCRLKREGFSKNGQMKMALGFIICCLEKIIRKNCELLKIVLLLHRVICCEMDIQFEKEYLRELYYEGKTSDKRHRYQPQIVKKYIRVVDILDSVDKVTDLYRFNALHYEKLTGDKAGLESVRVNDQYCIEFISSEETEKSITICNIIELSNHYI